jgi:hypothetical protein
MFPSSGSLTQHPLRPPGSWWRQFPGFVATMRYCDFRPSYPTRFVGLRTPGTDPCVCLHSARPDAGRRPGALRCGGLTPRFDDSAMVGSPRFLANPCVPMPCSATPAGPTHQALRCADAAPERTHAEGPCENLTFEAQRHGLGTRCLRFVLELLLWTQDALPAAGHALRGGIDYPQGSYERFP